MPIGNRECYSQDSPLRTLKIVTKENFLLYRNNQKNITDGNHAYITKITKLTVVSCVGSTNYWRVAPRGPSDREGVS